jgi:hypothetical protein
MLLAEFFAPLQSCATGAMAAYSNMGRLCGVDPPPRWIGSAKPDWICSSTGYAEEFAQFLQSIRISSSDFRGRCRRIVQDTPLNGIADSDGAWQEFVDMAECQFRDAYNEWNKDYRSLRDAWMEIPKQLSSESVASERAKASSIRYQIRAISDITVIEWFSDAGFLPRYGFPIHLQRLSVRIPRADRPDKSTTFEGYRLERQSLLALSEYVPGAQVLVGGRIVESKGILKHWTEANRDEALGLNYWALICANGHEYLASSQNELCPECSQLPYGPTQALMFPRFGYTSAAWEPPRPPGRNLDRVGDVVTTAARGFTLTAASHKDLSFAGVLGLSAAYFEAGEGELLLRNAGGRPWSSSGDGFAVCTRCGFAMSEEKPCNDPGLPPPSLPKKFRDHASVFAANIKTRCWPRNIEHEPVLRHKVLAATETTDVLILDWPTDSDEASLFSLGRALILAGARLLELDTRELSLELKPRGAGEFSILLYDAAPGGAGHCFELMKRGRQWLEQAREILHGSPLHDAACRRACLDCLLDFAGQFDVHRLDRRGALQLLDAVLL